MLCLALFDFAMLGFTLFTLTFFVWCWFAFREDRKSHPIYRGGAGGETLVLPRQQERHCA
jgi:hypothetical protein